MLCRRRCPRTMRDRSTCTRVPAIGSPNSSITRPWIAPPRVSARLAVNVSPSRRLIVRRRFEWTALTEDQRGDTRCAIRSAGIRPQEGRAVCRARLHLSSPVGCSSPRLDSRTSAPRTGAPVSAAVTSPLMLGGHRIDARRPLVVADWAARSADGSKRMPSTTPKRTRRMRSSSLHHCQLERALLASSSEKGTAAFLIRCQEFGIEMLSVFEVVGCDRRGTALPAAGQTIAKCRGIGIHDVGRIGNDVPTSPSSRETRQSIVRWPDRLPSRRH